MTAVDGEARSVVKMRISGSWIPLTSGILGRGTAERRDLVMHIVRLKGVEPLTLSSVGSS
jgi:hypothetical protein